MNAIGIDLGTTTISIVVAEIEKNKILESRTIQNGSFIHTEKEWERIQDAESIVKKAQDMLDTLLIRYSDIEYIGLTGQMHGILYVDKDGKSISPLYTWQDGRGNLVWKNTEESLVKWMNRVYDTNVAAGYGLVTHIYNSFHQLVPKRAVHFCTISDYLGMILTKRTVPLVHISNAASFGCFDVSAGQFQKAVLEDIGINTEILPEITEEIKIQGKYKGIPVGVSIGDNQASFLGSVGIQEGGILLNMGTGGQISVMSEKYFDIPGIETRPFINGQYLFVGASLCGGRAYAILERFFREYMIAAGCDNIMQYDVMERLGMMGAQERDKLLIDTSLCGTRMNPEKRGSICNISEDNFTPSTMIYGVLQGMTRELYDMFEQIKRNTGAEGGVLVASGNGLRKNQLLQKICSEMFEREIVLAVCEEEAAMGATLGSCLGRSAN